VSVKFAVGLSCLSIICPASYGQQAIAKISRRHALPAPSAGSSSTGVWSWHGSCAFLMTGENRAVKTNKATLNVIP